MEKRKNPSKNPTLSAYQQLEQYSKRNDVFISFTDLPKLGINPKNEYNTPTGIYTYPLKQVWPEMSKTKSTHFDTFGEGRPYIQVLQQKGSKFIEDISKTYSFPDLEKDMNKLRKLYPDTAKRTGSKQAHIKNQNEFIGKILDLEGSYDRVKAMLFSLDRKKFNRVLEKTKVAWSINRILGESENPKAWEENEIEYLTSLTNDLFDKLVMLQDHIILMLDSAEEKGAGKTINDELENTFDAVKRARMILSELYNDSYITDGGDEGIEWSIKHGKEAPNHYSAGGLLWNVTRLVANKNSDYTEAGATSRWNGIFRDLGYVGVADRSGAGIIHPAEATQAVFFSSKGYKHIDMILNKQHVKTKEFKNMEDFRDAAFDSSSNSVNFMFSNIIHILKNNSRDVTIGGSRRDFLKMLAIDLADNFKFYHRHSQATLADMELMILYYGTTKYLDGPSKKQFRQDMKTLAIEIKQGFNIKSAAQQAPLGIRMTSDQFLKAVKKLK